MLENAENIELQIKIERLERELEKQKALIQRNEAFAKAKIQLANIVSAEKTRLESSMSMLLKNGQDFILFFDKSQVLTLCTNSFICALGLTGMSQLKGKSISEIFVDIFTEDIIDEINGMASTIVNDNVSDSFITERKIDFNNSGEIRNYSEEITTLRDNDGQCEGFVIIFHDTTEILAAVHEANRANQAKSDFLATISHEIRTPMNAIIGLADILSNTSLNEKQTGILAQIKNSSKSMLALINDILDFSKVEAGKLDLIDEDFDFFDFLEDIQTVISFGMKEKELDFICTFDENLPKFLNSDSKRLRQILMNILNNAYKYTSSGSVEFKVSSKQCPDADLKHMALICFSVTDTGIGIKEEDLPKLFNEFQQLDVVKNKGVSGTGLGLAITKKLTALLNGKVSVSSVYGHGSTFTVEIPLPIGSPTDVTTNTDDGVVNFIAPDAKVLVVDDVEINIEIVEFMLEPLEIVIEKAYDGKQALKMISESQYDLVFMDHMMPLMDGAEATKEVRALDGPSSKTKIVALTANAVSGVEEMLMQAGFDGFLSKPVSEEDLTKMLYNTLPKEKIIKIA